MSLCRSEDTLATLKGEAAELALLCSQSRAFRLFLRTPVVPQHKKIAVIRAIFEGKIHKLLLSFLVLLAQRRRESFLPQVLEAFAAQYHERVGVVQAAVTLSFHPEAAVLSRFREFVEEKTGKRASLTVRVDPGIIGGYLLSVGNWQVDNRVSSHLRGIRKHLT